MLAGNISKLIEDIRTTVRDCPWVKEQTLDSFKNEPLSEAMEVKEAIDKKDYKNLCEELGDLIYDALLLSLIAERDRLFKLEDVIFEVNEKIKRRKPWCFGKEKVSSSEEAVKRWLEIKKSEKSLSLEKKGLGKKED